MSDSHPLNLANGDADAHMLPPVHRKHAVVIRYVAKYCTAGGTSQSKMAYPAIPKGAQIIKGRKRVLYLSDRMAPIAYTIAPHILTGMTRYCAWTVEY